ncbi:hypothetical protein QBC39DRAFT_433035 [Podospora conica]|nr:hypothetical protein QBC39DRAFT_433035 [Schizothecium conicum]
MSKWDAQKERDLGAAIFAATGPHPPEVKERVVEMMAEAGHIVNWDALSATRGQPEAKPTKLLQAAQPPSTFTMVRWEDVREDLLDALMQVTLPLTREQQDNIVAILNERGHQVTWNAMSRLLLPFSTILDKTQRSNLSTPHRLNFIMASKSKTWDAESNLDVLKVLNNYYHPNAADCKAMIGALHAKGYTYSDGALLDMRAIIDRLHSQGYSFTDSALQQPTVIMPKPAPTNWDNEAHLALLQALVLKAPPNAAQWDDVLEEVGKKVEMAKGKPSGERMTWDHETDQQLLICMSQVALPSAAQIKEVAELMETKFEHNLTPKAITQHLQKLRRKEIGGGTGSGDASSTPKTPASKKKAAPAAKTASTGRKRKTAKQSATVAAFMQGDDDDDDEETPSKKKVKKSAAAADDDEEDVKQEIIDIADEDNPVSYSPKPYVKDEEDHYEPDQSAFGASLYGS